MVSEAELADYLVEIRNHVCSRCIERPPEAPPCAPHGKRCGVELHLPEIVELAHRVRSGRVDPYVERFHADVCSHCANQPTQQCPCPLDYLISLAIQAIEMVDERRAAEAPASG